MATQYNHEGLQLWYGTPDAPAPENGAAPDCEVALILGVAPVHPSNTVIVRYRVPGGPIQTLRAAAMGADYGQSKQYFRAVFPNLLAGQRVEYSPVLLCAGRQVPDVATAATFPAAFEVGAVLAPSQAASQAHSVDPPGAFPVKLDYLCRVTAQLNRAPEVIGVTPEGLKVDWFIVGGTVTGPKLQATIRPAGGDWMTIRPDGIGTLDIRATFETAEGALIYMMTSGTFELGPDGYANFLQKRWPKTPAVRPVPRFLTAHAQYQWLNRVQCMGVGVVHMDDLQVVYDLYVIR